MTSLDLRCHQEVTATRSGVSLLVSPHPFFCCLFFTEQAAGVYHRESRKGRYQLTYKEAKALCKYEGGKLATYKQLEAARKIGLWLTHKLIVLHSCQTSAPGIITHRGAVTLPFPSCSFLRLTNPLTTSIQNLLCLNSFKSPFAFQCFHETSVLSFHTMDRSARLSSDASLNPLECFECIL